MEEKYIINAIFIIFSIFFWLYISYKEKWTNNVDGVMAWLFWMPMTYLFLWLIHYLTTKFLFWF